MENRSANNRNKLQRISWDGMIKYEPRQQNID